MIYLLRKHDIQPLRICMIRYPFLHTPPAYIIPEGDIICEAYIIRSVRNGYH